MRSAAWCVWMQSERDELLRRHNVCTFMVVVTLSHPTLQPDDVDESLFGSPPQCSLRMFGINSPTVYVGQLI